MNYSIVDYYGKNTNKCGYCKGQSGISHGMHAYRMNPADYQDLIDRGWRRSGHYCYKPHQKTTCCPCYTIKCDALEFQPTKSQKKVLNRMTRFLRDGKKDASELQQEKSAAAALAEDKGGGGGVVAVDGAGIREEPQAPNMPLLELNVQAIAANNAEHCKATTVEAAEQKTADMQIHAINEQLLEQATNASVASSSLHSSKKSLDGSNPPRKKAKQMRLERKQAKLEAAGATALWPKNNNNNNKNVEKTLRDYIQDASANDKHKLELKLFNVKNREMLKARNEVYALYQRYQTHTHNDPPESIKEYLEFLQYSPLEHIKTADGPPSGYGSFHQQYWLDDKLIAVGVIDILPYCISSVYFFYDPDYSFLSLGTYGSLREIAFVQELAQIVPALKYYYMGFYIHSCPKMRYKGKLTPSYLLCPETYKWILLTDEIRKKLNAQKYQRLNVNAADKDVDEFLENQIDAVLLLVEHNKIISYRQFRQSFNIDTLDNMLDIIKSRIYKEITGDPDDREEILEYGHLVGKSCAHRLLYVKI